MLKIMAEAASYLPYPIAASKKMSASAKPKSL